MWLVTTVTQQMVAPQTLNQIMLNWCYVHKLETELSELE